MDRLSRVVWFEGMHLSQHHFQTQARYYEESIQFAFGQLQSHAHGLTSVRLNRDALADGMVVLEQAEGVLPDGTHFSIPDDDPVPDELNASETFDASKGRHYVLLTLPEGHTVSMTEAQGTRHRFSAVARDVSDEFAPSDHREIQVGRRNFSLEVASELPSVPALPVARLRPDGRGVPRWDDAFIPPCLRVGASARLVRLLSDLHKTMKRKADALRADQQVSASVAQYGERELASFWLGHTLRSSLPILGHHVATGAGHPEAVYRELARLAGALCTFSRGTKPADVPAYEHDDLTATFEALERMIQALMEPHFPPRIVSVPLEAHHTGFHIAKSIDPRALQPCSWLLAVDPEGLQLTPSEVRAEMAGSAKLACITRILELVDTGTAGLRMIPVDELPADINPKLGTEYFRVLQEGELWHQVRDEKTIALRPPDALATAKYTILALVPS